VQHLVVDAEESGLRLDRFLGQRFPGIPATHWFRVIRRGEVRVAGGRATPSRRLEAGERVRVPPVRAQVGDPEASRRPPARLVESVTAAIVRRDDRLLVLDKPAGLAVHGGSGTSFGLIEALRAALPDETLELVHRLDRDTSGCLLVARRASALRTLHALLREHAFEKRYLALLAGHWPLGEKRIDVPLRTDTRVGGERTVRAHVSGKPAVSDFRPVQFFGRRATLVEVTIHTGRTHQIRVHAAHAGYPVAGDPKYGDAEANELLGTFGLARMFLHASSVSFTWPDSGVDFSANAPLPPELGAVLDRLADAARRRGR
jgi:23S rRNA pseudouridine955/2504/2580 synthase